MWGEESPIPKGGLEILTQVTFKIEEEKKRFLLRLVDLIKENYEMPKSEAHTAQKMKFSIKNFSSKCDQIHSFLRIWSHILEKSLMEGFFVCSDMKLLRTKKMGSAMKITLMTRILCSWSMTKKKGPLIHLYFSFFFVISVERKSFKNCNIVCSKKFRML